MEPHTYPRRILLAVTGLSPQVVTETLYALVVKPGDGRMPFVPTEIHIITTGQGAAHARLNLLTDEPGWFYRLCRDYHLPAIRFDDSTLHKVTDAAGQPLDDIRTPADNERVADCIAEIVRDLTADDTAAVHVSLAGGRKTMGYYLGYALSLYGRPQDRLSHVLVSAPFESHPEFYYPTREQRVIQTREAKPRPLDCRDAVVELAEIPFVRMRHGLDDRLREGTAGFSDSVAAAQRALGPAELVIDLAGRRIRAGGTVVRLPPADIAFMSWFARRRVENAPALTCPAESVPEQGYAIEYLRHYRAVIGAMGDDDRAVVRYGNGMSKQDFLERKSKLLRTLKKAIGPAAEAYSIHGRGRPARYELKIDATAIQFETISEDVATDAQDSVHD